MFLHLNRLVNAKNRADVKHQPILVNLDYVISISEHTDGGTVLLMSTSENTIRVRESLAQLTQMVLAGQQMPPSIA
jgi:hypothetical protein